MSFREWLSESQVRVTDTWPINKITYDMDSDHGRRQYDIDLSDMLGRMKRAPRKEVSDSVVKEPYTITCWRGFDLRSFERDVREEGGRMFIKGEKAMEGMLWFTHSLQSPGSDPMHYALDHARGDGYLLTYPLRCTKSYRLIKYDDGSEMSEAPEGHREDPTTLRGSAVLDGRLYDLPKGWFFTWQIQKHIGYKGTLEIDESMLTRVS